VTTLLKGLAWTIALLSGIATLFALFGGQQWLESKGWTLDPEVSAVEQTAEEPDDELTAKAVSGREGGDGFEVSAVGDWAVRTLDGPFDNFFWAFIIVNLLTLAAAGAGALALYATADDGFAQFFEVTGILILGSIAVYLGFVVHTVSPGWLAWYMVASILAAVIGFFLPVFRDV